MDALPSPGRRPMWPWIVVALAATLGPLIIKLEGRPWWCKCGEPRLWISQSSGPHTSQHFLDPYAATHIEHGLLFFLVLILLRVRKPSIRWSLAVVAEALWEIAENARFIVERYRQAAAPDYFGDSVANSFGDILACIAGYALAEKLGGRRALIALVVLELLMLAWIRDSLLLNIVMLLFPLDAIRAWQTAA